MGGGPFERSSVAHSKRRIFNRREIDITLTLEGTNGRSVYLIENKLDTAPQPRQAESYREEARALVDRGEATAVTTVLVCPADYARSAEVFARKFDQVVTYEDVTAFLASRSQGCTGELQARLSHRRDLMEQATTKARRGYEPVVLPDIGVFARRYVALQKRKE